MITFIARQWNINFVLAIRPGCSHSGNYYSSDMNAASTSKISNHRSFRCNHLRSTCNHQYQSATMFILPPETNLKKSTPNWNQVHS